MLRNGVQAALGRVRVPRWVAGCRFSGLSRPADVALASTQELPTIVPYTYGSSQFRHRTFDDRKIYYQPPLLDEAPATGSAPLPRPPTHSYIEMFYPFSSNPTLREEYRRFETTELRYGLVLEDIDTFAGDVAQRHAGPGVKVVVTSYVDKISWLQHGARGALAVDRDLRLAGQVCWVGRSSMEVLLQLSSCQPGPRPTWDVLGTARFVMVARNDALTHSVPVPPLLPTTAEEKRLFKLGAGHQSARRLRQEHSLTQKPPTAEEVLLMHNLVRSGASRERRQEQQQQLPAPGSNRAAAAVEVGSSDSGEEANEEPEMRMRPGVVAHAAAVPMWRTQHSHTCLMHLQDRNNHHRIFGGHMLRLAFELAFSTASLHAGIYCPPLSMDDIAFFHPVPIGCIVQFLSKVVYTEGPVMRVHVRALKMEPGSSATTLTNTFSIAFRCPTGPAPQVIPETFQEYLEYLEGHRQHRADQLDTEQLEAVAAGALQAKI